MHEDIKIDNLMIDEKGRLYLIDLGVALRRGKLDERDVIAGNFLTISPEKSYLQ